MIVMTQKVFELFQHDVVKFDDFSLMSIKFYPNVILISSRIDHRSELKWCELSIYVMLW